MLKKFLSKSWKTRRSLLPFFIGAWVILLPILILLVKSPQKVEAGWFNEFWLYRQKVNISNASGSEQTNYQVSFTLDTSDTSKFLSTCNDIRITDVGGKILPYWIEENNPGCGSATTKIWTKVSAIPTTGTTLYAYYGNPSATQVQDGNKVFEFFDDFNSTTLDTTKWTNVNAATLTFNGTNVVID